MADHDSASDLLDHARHPFHKGPLPGLTHAFSTRNPLCGDEVTLQVRIGEGRVQAAWFEGQGCAVSQAATSMLCELLDGAGLDRASALNEQDMLGRIGVSLSPTKQCCGLLAFRAWQGMVQNLDTKKGSGG